MSYFSRMATKRAKHQNGSGDQNKHDKNATRTFGKVHSIQLIKIKRFTFGGNGCGSYQNKYEQPQMHKKEQKSKLISV